MAVAVTTTRNLAWDAAGNVTETEQTSTAPADAAQQQVLRTRNTFAADPAGRFVSKLARVQQLDGTGALVADTVTEYDHAPEGTVGAQGLVTRRLALALTDTLAADVYGADLPDFAALGYFRRAGSDGWWISLAAYDRTDDAAGLRGTVTGPRGAQTSFSFDPLRVFPAQITMPFGNTITARYDARISRPVRLTTASGDAYTAVYDALSRLIATVDPGDSAALPTGQVQYTTTTLPIEVLRRQRAVSGDSATIDTRERFDSSGLLLERRVRDETGEIVVRSHTYNARGLLARSYVESRAAGPAYAAPAPSEPHTAYHYDALGRLIRLVNPDGSLRTLSYGPGVIEEADEEQNRSDPGAPHVGKVTRRFVDPTERVHSIEQHIAGRTVTSTYTHDVKGNLIRHVDALGNEVRTWFDLLGHVIRVSRPEQIAVSVLDPSGNVVEVRTGGGRVFRDFDLADRPIAERFGSPASQPVVRFTYHDAGRPPPPEAGAHSAGRLVRTDDSGGATVLTYDARGRVTRKAWTPPGGTTRMLDQEYRSDGQTARIAYPDAGAGRTALDHQYDARGLLSSVPTVAGEIKYDLAGRRTLLRYANGTAQTATYDQRGRLASLQVTGPDGPLWSSTYTVDGAGNLLRVDSPDPTVAATYVYDDLYRLTEATRGDGRHWTYAYDDAGNLTHKSDVGDYHYGEGGAPATCLTSAGPDSFTYTANGEMSTTPWGTQSFDPLGRLTRIVSPDGHGSVDFSYNFSGARVTARTSGSVPASVDLVTPDPLYSIERGTLVLNLADFAREPAGSPRFYLHRDHLGSLVLVTDAAGKVAETRRYDPYGGVLAKTGAADTPSGFTGGVPDAWTGLLYLQARYYQPHLGRFISPDPEVQNIYDPAAWSSYVYCRGNPTSYVDPSGRDFWRAFAVVLAVAALVVLTVVTLGAATPVAIGVIIGVVAGGVVDGVTAAKKHGDFGDILTGILVGAAVGGWAAYLGATAGGFIVGKLGTGVLGSAVSGAASGAINGAAMGFAAAFAGKEQFTDGVNIVWQSALFGLAAGAALGALTGMVNSGDIKEPTKSIQEEEADKAKGFVRGEQSKPPPPQTAGDTPPSSGSPNQPAPTSPETGIKKAGMYFADPFVERAKFYAGKLGALVWVQVLAEDLPSGAWGIFHEDIKEYVRRHDIKFQL